MTLITILLYLEAKFDYGYFIILFALWFSDFTQKISSNFKQNEGVTLIFPIQNEIKIRENHCHAIIFGQNDLKLCRILKPLPKKNDKIAIVKFCL